MKALIFAHHLEAQSFIEHFGLRLKTNFVADLYESDQWLLLITGEGLQNALQKTSAFFSQFGKNIECAFNLGVAGQLRDKISLGDIVSIRTVFAQFDEPQYKSFTSHDAQAKFDLISFSSRVHSSETKNKLSFFGDLVDREFWGIASSAQLFSIPFYSYKYVSDQADESVDCQRVKDEARAISQKLLQYFLKTPLLLDSPNSTVFPSVKKQEQHLEIFTHPEITTRFYFTEAQKKRLISLLKQIKKSEKIFLTADDLLSHDASPTSWPAKKRTQMLLTNLEKILSPYSPKEKLMAMVLPYQDENFQFQFLGESKKYESDKFKITITVNAPEDLPIATEKLKKFNWNKYQDILNGL
jgi:hypothetical protein